MFPQAKSIWVESGLQDLSLVHDLQIMHTHAGGEGPLLLWSHDALVGEKKTFKAMFCDSTTKSSCCTGRPASAIPMQ